MPQISKKDNNHTLYSFGKEETRFPFTKAESKAVDEPIDLINQPNLGLPKASMDKTCLTAKKGESHSCLAPLTALPKWNGYPIQSRSEQIEKALGYIKLKMDDFLYG